MFRRLLMFFIAGKVFKMIRNRGRGRSFRSSGWGSRHASGNGRISGLFSRRRRSFI